MVNGPRLLAQEIKEQVTAYYDIENCMFRSADEERDLTRREMLKLIEKNKQDKVEKIINDLKKVIQSRLTRQQHDSIKDEISFLSEALIWSRDQVLLKIIELERGLTKSIAGYEVKLWEDKYRDIVHAVPVRFDHDGRLSDELFICVDPGESEINGFKIFYTSSNTKLHNMINRAMKKNRNSRDINHRIPFDVIKLRDEARNHRAREYDVVVRGRRPGKDISRADFYERLRQDRIYHDTHREISETFPWLRSKQPEGDHSLECFTRIMGDENFKKPEGIYGKLRENIVKALNGHKRAAKFIAEYAVEDVIAVWSAEKKSKYLERVINAMEIAPFLTLTQGLFSSNAWRKMHDFRYWKRFHCHRSFNYDQKIENDQRQIFSKRLVSLMKRRLEFVGIPSFPVSGFYHRVCQTYFPLEYLLRDYLIAIEPSWMGYFEHLSHDPIERFAELAYPDAFLSTVLEDYYFAINSKLRFEEKLQKINQSRNEILGKIEDFTNRNYPELNKFRFILNCLREDYRSIYLAFSNEERSKIRLPSMIESGQTEFPYSSYFESDNYDFMRLTDNIAQMIESATDGMKRKFDRFLRNFSVLERTIDEFPYRGDVSRRNLVYLCALRLEFLTKEKEFFDDYGIQVSKDTDDMPSLRTSVRKAFEVFRTDLEKSKARVIDLRIGSRYFYLYGGDLSDNYSSLLPIRYIDNYVVQPYSRENKSMQMEMFCEDGIRVDDAKGMPFA